MNPDEVIEELTQAVAAIQANVQAFESACSETGDQALLVQGRYDEKTDQLMEELNDLSGDSEALVTVIMEDAIQTTEEVNNEVSNTINEYLTDLETNIETRLEALTDAYTEAQDETVSFIDETSGQVEDVADAYDGVGDTYRQSLNTSIETLTEIEKGVQEQLSSFLETMTGQIQTSHDNAMQLHNDFIDSTVNAEFESLFEGYTGDFSEFSESQFESLENMGEMVSDKFEELSMELIDYADDKATEEVKEKVNGMIDHIVEELASTVSESIVKSSVGVSVTGATTPLLPYLVAFNAIFNALDTAIGMWKSFKQGIGL